MTTMPEDLLYMPRRRSLSPVEQARRSGQQSLSPLEQARRIAEREEPSLQTRGLKCPVCKFEHQEVGRQSPQGNFIPETRHVCSHGCRVIFMKTDCPICFEEVEPPVVAFPCGHGVCKPCFERLGGLTGEAIQQVAGRRMLSAQEILENALEESPASRPTRQPQLTGNPPRRLNQLLNPQIRPMRPLRAPFHGRLSRRDSLLTVPLRSQLSNADEGSDDSSASERAQTGILAEDDDASSISSDGRFLNTSRQRRSDLTRSIDANEESGAHENHRRRRRRLNHDGETAENRRDSNPRFSHMLGLEPNGQQHALNRGSAPTNDHPSEVARPRIHANNNGGATGQTSSSPILLLDSDSEGSSSDAIPGNHDNDSAISGYVQGGLAYV